MKSVYAEHLSYNLNENSKRNDPWEQWTIHEHEISDVFFLARLVVCGKLGRINSFRLHYKSISLPLDASMSSSVDTDQTPRSGSALFAQGALSKYLVQMRHTSGYSNTRFLGRLFTR